MLQSIQLKMKSRLIGCGRTERRRAAAGRGQNAATPGGRADRDPAPRRDGPAHRPVGGADQRRPGGHGPAVCAGVERRGGAERGADRGRRPGWPRLRQPHRQSRSCPGRERRCAGRYDVGPAGLRSVRLRSRRLCGLAPRCRR